MGQFAFAVAVAVVIAAVATLRRGPAIAVLASVPFVWLGALSYSLYLWHWPVYLVLTPDRTDLHGWALFGVRVAVSLALAAVSYHLVEQPIRLRRVRLPRPGVLAVAGVGAVALLVTARPPGARRQGDELGQARSGPGTGGDRSPGAHLVPAARPASPAPPCAPPAPQRPSAAGGRGGRGLGGLLAPRLLPTGDPRGDPAPDRHRHRVRDHGAGHHRTGSDARRGVRRAWRDYWTRALDGPVEPDVVLMVTGAWEIRDHWLDDEPLTPQTPEATEYVDAQLEEAYRLVRSRTPARIGALELSCAPRIEQGLGESVLASTDVARVDWFNERLRALADRHPGDVVLISINDKVCPDGRAVDKLDGVRLRYDGVHWTEEGGPQAWAWILPHLFDLAYRPS